MGSPDERRRSDRARTAILTAAAEAVAEVGYAKTSIEGIAARAGVGKQTIYRWWPSKGAVVLDALVTEQPESEWPDTGDLAADLRLVLRATTAEFADEATSATLRAVMIDMQQDAALSDQVMTRMLGPQLAATKRRLEAAQRAGQVADGIDLDVAVEVIFGPVYHRWILRTHPFDEAYADALTELAVRALGPG
ncbi:transcriptional regulator, TetR family [Kribbella flavida DSM 17836]|uniref:Transcriptional regulator, TetR family n=1 Tax=Kribbella flavida (strain DSM 17836 / JCM 10339 / NBRC 14399) TaxID=479435 RepID=D2Q2P6_KRIFD|nr:TetR/AcrR family transcriptional regulator [Kribbella flavida]ADB30227.1 transcriptional regulator, TetR family [Kribbella flavida DSM 17836]